MAEWQSIDTAPKDRWLYLWDTDAAESWAEECESDEPYTPTAARWNGFWWMDEQDCPVKGSTHWRELFEPPLKGGE